VKFLIFNFKFLVAEGDKSSKNQDPSSRETPSSKLQKSELTAKNTKITKKYAGFAQFIRPVASLQWGFLSFRLRLCGSAALR